VFSAHPRQRELSWYTLFFQQPEAEALVAADDWALLRQMFGLNANEAELQAYIDALSQPGALSRPVIKTPVTTNRTICQRVIWKVPLRFMLADFGAPERSCWHNLEDQL
jgi:hypothetical protein